MVYALTMRSAVLLAARVASVVMLRALPPVVLLVFVLLLLAILSWIHRTQADWLRFLGLIWMAQNAYELVPSTSREMIVQYLSTTADNWLWKNETVTRYWSADGDL